jgi:hypothetical protein
MTDDSDPPSDAERQGGEPLGDAEARKKGPWAERADEGLVPAELRGSEDDIDLRAGDNADATTDGGPEPAPGVEPNLRDAAAGPRQTDVRSADS